MEKRQVERRLERAFRSAPLSYGTGRVRERRKPFELAQAIVPAGKPQSYRDCRHGEVLEELQRLGIGTRRLMSKPFGINLGLAWDQRDRLDCALSAGARVISLFWGDPSALIPQAHASGAIVLVTVGSANEAADAVESGADVVVAHGWEAGGTSGARSRRSRLCRVWSTRSRPSR